MLERTLERVRMRLATDVGDDANRQAYVRALIRYNEFLVEESVLLHSQPK